MANPTMKIIAESTHAYTGEGATMQGTLTKSVAVTLLTIISAAVSGFYLATSPMAYMALIIGVIGSFILALITSFKPSMAPVTVSGYAICEGMVLGIISMLYEQMYFGITAIAVGVTFATLLTMLFIWRAGIIKVTDKVRSMIISMTMAVFVFYLIAMIASIFGYHIMPNSGIFGIALSFIIAGVAAFNLLLDFDTIERSVAMGAPKYMEYFCAFSLLVTLVWLYLEILRLVAMIYSMINGRDD